MFVLCGSVTSCTWQRCSHPLFLARQRCFIFQCLSLRSSPISQYEQTQMSHSRILSLTVEAFTHTHTSGLLSLWGFSTGVMLFLLYRPYIYCPTSAVLNFSPRAPPLCIFRMLLLSLQIFVLFECKCPAKWTSQDIPPWFQFEANVYIPFKVHWSVQDVN